MSKLDFVPSHCQRETDETKPKVEANGRKAVFNNNDKALVHLIDVDCWIQGSEGLRADYIAVKPTVVDVIVELKGSDIPHAIQQIAATAQHWRESSGTTKMLGGLLVFRHSPERSASLDNRKKKLIKNGINLVVDKTGKTEYRFEMFLGK